jgi:hypothetical protein
LQKLNQEEINALVKGKSLAKKQIKVLPKSRGLTRKS